MTPDLLPPPRRAKKWPPHSFRARFQDRWFLFKVIIGLLVICQLNVLYMMNSVPSPAALSEAIHGFFGLPISSSLLTDDVEPEVYFHKPAYETIRRIVNASTILSWKGTTDEFFQELNITTLLRPYIDIEKIHGRSHEEKIKVWKDTTRYYVWETNICYAARAFMEAGAVKKHVLFTYLNENRGAFSRDVPNRTVVWNHLATNWVSWGCTDDEIFRYLDHPNTRAVITTQHQSYYHKKVHSLPLGVYPLMKKHVLGQIHLPQQDRTQLLMVNDNGAKHRADIVRSVMASFNGTVKNTYSKGNFGPYLEEIRRSKFILSPSGLGWDCYRIWDALYMGSIPIIEKYGRKVDGWRRSLDDLPVLWVQHFNEVTPELLNQRYLEIVAKAPKYNYEKLTIFWWIDFIKSFVPEDTSVSRPLPQESTSNDVLWDYNGGPRRRFPHILHPFKSLQVYNESIQQNSTFERITKEHQ